MRKFREPRARSFEVSTPISFFRAHPVDMLLPQIAEALLTGSVTAIFLCICPNGLTLVTILGVNAFRFVYYPVGAEENRRLSSAWQLFLNPFRALPRHVIPPARSSSTSASRL
jgi:hypothetical protein